jgi:hypothetical protein
VTRHSTARRYWTSTSPSLFLVVLAAACQRPEAAAYRTRRVEVLEASAGPADGVVRTALADAQRDRRRLLVYVSATWCEPCERFQAAVRAGHLDSTFPDLRLLKFDEDRDLARLARAGYNGQFIPRFVVPGADGRGTGQRHEGGSKSEDTVASFIAPQLARLLGTPLPARAQP